MRFLPFLLICCISGARQQNIDYYWRDFYEKIPTDALALGRDLDGKNLYVVQAYIHELGIFFGDLTEGATIPEISGYGPRKPDKLLKIFCSRHQKNFGWKLSNSTKFHLDMLDTNPVIGGYHHKGGPLGFLHVGRVTYNGIMKICEIVSFQLENVLCYFVYGGKEMSYNSYEVLVWLETTPNHNETNVVIC